MKVLIDICVVPLGTDVSVSKYVVACEKVFTAAGLKCSLHANGTNIEGDWDEVFAAVKRCHEVIHAMDTPRIFTSLRINTRVDKEQTLEDKIISVQSKLSGNLNNETQ